MSNFYFEYKKIIKCIFVFIIFIIFTFIIRNYFNPFFIIILLFLLCSPIYNVLCKYNVFNDKINAIISLIFINLILFILIIIIGNFIYICINTTIKNWMDLKYIVNNILVKLSDLFNLDFNILNKKIKEYFNIFFNSGFLRQGAIYTTDRIFAYFIGNITVYFILVDKYVIVNLIKKVFSQSKINFLQDKILDIKKMAKVEIILVIITTVETILGLMLLNIKNFFSLGILCGILDVLPYIGNILIFFPLIIYNIFEKRYIVSFGLVCLYILLVVSRQILETKFISDKFKIHPLLIILSLYVGIKIFGFLGLIMGPLYVVIVKEIIENKEWGCLK